MATPHECEVLWLPTPEGNTWRNGHYLESKHHHNGTVTIESHHDSRKDHEECHHDDSHPFKIIGVSHVPYLIYWSLSGDIVASTRPCTHPIHVFHQCDDGEKSLLFNVRASANYSA